MAFRTEVLVIIVFFNPFLPPVAICENMSWFGAEKAARCAVSYWPSVVVVAAVAPVIGVVTIFQNFTKPRLEFPPFSFTIIKGLSSPSSGGTHTSP